MAETHSGVFPILSEMMERLERQNADIILDADGVVRAWNDQAVDILGWTAVEALGRCLTDLCIPPAMRTFHTAGLRKWRQEALVMIACKRMQTLALHRDGREIPVYLDVQIVRHRSPETIQFLGWITAVEEEDDAGT